MNRVDSNGLQRWLERMLLLLIHFMAWGYVAQIVMRPVEEWPFYFAAISALILALALLCTRGWFRAISAAFLFAGMVILWRNHVPMTDAWRFFGSTTNILTLLIFAPFFAIPITLGAYHRSALLIVRGKVHQPHSIYFVLSAFTYLLATLMNVAAIVASFTTLHHLSRSYPKDVAETINFRAFARGHSLAMIWSPVGAGLGVALARVPEADPGTVLAMGFGFSIFMLLLDTWFIKVWSRRHAAAVDLPTSAARPQRIAVSHWQHMGVFCGVIVLFVFGVIVLHEWWAMPVIDAVIVLILGVSLIWGLCLKKPKRLWKELKTKSTKGVLGLLPQIMLFISVGFFTQALTVSGAMESLVQWVTYWSASFGWLLIILIVLLAVVSSQMGLFPALIIMLLTDLVPYDAMHLRPEWFVFAVTAASVGGVPASPLTINVNLVASLMRVDPLQVSRSNLYFAGIILSSVSLLTIGLSLLFPA